MNVALPFVGTAHQYSFFACSIYWIYIIKYRAVDAQFVGVPLLLASIDVIGNEYIYKTNLMIRLGWPLL